MSNIVKKLQSVPDFYPMRGASNSQIEQAERSLCLRFADEYRVYLATFGAASFDGHELLGICAFSRLNVVDVTLSERMNNPAIPANWYVIEQANIDGIIVWQSSTGEVHQTMPNVPPVRLCESLCEYIER